MSTRPEAHLALEVRKLAMVYRTRAENLVVLDGVDLRVRAGQLLCVLGPSGSGKTTLVELCSGLRRPSGGDVYVAGTELGSMSQDQAARFRRRNIGIVFQLFNLSPLLSVAENVALPLLCDGVPLAQLDGAISRVLERLGIAHLGSRSAGELSGGEQQRVAIARALLPEPSLILADEPTGNLDSRRGQEVLALLRELVDERGITTAILTHDLRAADYADRVIRLQAGRIDEDLPGPPRPGPATGSR